MDNWGMRPVALMEERRRVCRTDHVYPEGREAPLELCDGWQQDRRVMGGSKQLFSVI